MNDKFSMTTSQGLKIRNKILKIKKALAADKKMWGGYHHDGRGMRYLAPALYLKISDYKGALRYFRWFSKAFPDDSGYPIFLFEWAITLFKNGKLKDAEKKSLETFMANTYLIDKFFNREQLHFDKWEGSSWEFKELAEDFPYSLVQEDLKDFAEWLSKFVTSPGFYKIANEYITISIKLKEEPVGKTRTILVNRMSKLLNNY